MGLGEGSVEMCSCNVLFSVYSHLLDVTQQTAFIAELLIEANSLVTGGLQQYVCNNN